jgi:hypothetical protein
MTMNSTVGRPRALSDAQVWQVLDFLQANASGQMLQESGVWAYPVRMPDAPLLCRPGRSQTVRSLAGQRLRVAVVGPGVVAPADDPRLVTLQVGLPRTAPSDPECRADSPELSTALSLLLGVPSAPLGAYQLLVDRDGWLRARGQPGQNAWSEDDLVCRSTITPTASAGKPSTGDGLDGLIRRMDGEPVRLLRSGFPH